MAHDAATRKRVRTAYVQGMALTAAADHAEVPYNTARRWKAADLALGDDWDVARNARRMTRSGVEEMANQVLGELAEQFVVTLNALKADKDMKAEVRAKIMVQLMDGYNKAIAAATRAMPDANRLATAMDVIRHVTDLLGARFPKLRGEFVDAMEQLGPDIVREFGGGGQR